MLPDLSIDTFDFEMYGRMAVRDFCTKQIVIRDRMIRQQHEVINYLIGRI